MAQNGMVEWWNGGMMEYGKTGQVEGRVMAAFALLRIPLPDRFMVDV
jgi:hypothetical protein